jgi:hypothetical protein
LFLQDKNHSIFFLLTLKKLTNDKRTLPYAFFVLFAGTGVGGNGEYLLIKVRMAIYFEVISPYKEKSIK